MASRIELFDRVAGGRLIAAYVNVGGSQASTASSTSRKAWAGSDEKGVMSGLAILYRLGFTGGRKFSMTQTSLCDCPAENAARLPSG